MKQQEKEDVIVKVTKKLRFHSIIGGVCIIAAAFITLLIGEKLDVSLNTPDYEKPIKIYCRTIGTNNFDGLMKAFPKYLVEDINANAMKAYKSDYKDEFMKSIGIEASSITYQITNIMKANEADLKDAEDVVASKYGAIVKLSEGYQLKIKLNIKSKTGTKEENVVFYVVKIGSNWYIPDLECLPEF